MKTTGLGTQRAAVGQQESFRFSSVLSPNQIWGLFFGLWVLFLSGILTPFLGSPGIVQAVRLNSILSSKQEAINQAENDVIQLQKDAEQLEKNRVVQQREIRRVLGYAATNELIFDFSADRLPANAPSH